MASFGPDGSSIVRLPAPYRPYRSLASNTAAYRVLAR